MPNSNSRTSLNLSTSHHDASFRWQFCAEQKIYFPSTHDFQQTLDNYQGVYLDSTRARLVAHEQKVGSYKSSIDWCTTLDRLLERHVVASLHAIHSDLSLSRTILDQLAEQSMIELQMIPQDAIEKLDQLSLR
jgi:hypothetical protein